MKTTLLISAATLCLAACTTMDENGATRPVADGNAEQCDASPAQHLVGQKATAETGAELLRLTNARQLRWGAPGSAMTMDFRPDRLTVSYDDKMMIERISCG